MRINFPTALPPSPAMILMFMIAAVLTVPLIIRRVRPYCQVYWGQANATFLVAGGLRTIVTTNAHYIQLQGSGQSLIPKQPML